MGTESGGVAGGASVAARQRDRDGLATDEVDESAGVPDHVHQAADHRVRILMAEGQRSINLAVSAGIVAAEAMRQTGGFEGLS